MAKSRIRVIHTAHPPIGNTNTAIEAGGFIYITGVIGMDSNTGTLAGVDHNDEMRQIFKNVGEVLKQEHLTWGNIISSSVQVISMKFLSDINKIYAEIFKGYEYPSREVMEVTMLPKNAKVQISFVLYKG